MLTWFQEAFRAKTFPLRDEISELKGRAQDSGARCSESFARFDRDTCSWKTRQCSLLAGSEEFSETWPRAGSMRSGWCSARMTSELRTEGNESGFWATPTCNDAKNNGSLSQLKRNSMPLNLQVMWPTPLASDWKGPNRSSRRSASGHGLAVAAGGKLNPTWVEWLMGWPLGWTGSEPLETDKFLSWLQEHSLNLNGG